jgi:hypothetical protein
VIVAAAISTAIFFFHMIQYLPFKVFYLLYLRYSDTIRKVC